MQFSTKPHFTFSILSWEHLSFVNCHHSKSLWICRFYLNFVKSFLNVKSESLLFPATSVNHGDWITLKIAFFALFLARVRNLNLMCKAQDDA